MSYFNYILDINLEDSKPAFLHNTPAHDDASPCSKVWLQKLYQFRRYCLDKHSAILNLVRLKLPLLVQYLSKSGWTQAWPEGGMDDTTKYPSLFSTCQSLVGHRHGQRGVRMTLQSIPPCSVPVKVWLDTDMARGG